MRTLSTALILGSALFFTSSLASAGQGYKSTITNIPAQPIRIDVSLGTDLASRAEAFPNGYKECSRRRSVRINGFACDGHLGQRDLDALVNKIEEDTLRSLTKKGLTVSDDGSLVLKLTLVNAKNNRPTQSQISQQVTLSVRSIREGGAELSGELLQADGSSLGTISYTYYDDIFLDGFSQASTTWTDAKEAIDRFASKLARDFAKHSPKT